MTNFTVGPYPLQIVGAGIDNSPLTVQNTGSVSIYLSGDPGVSPTAFEYKIDAGGDFTWPPGKPLSVCTGPGVIGQISYGGTGNVHVNSGSTNVTGAVTINGSVPIAGPVTVSGTVAISGGTVGLSGPVTINGGVSVTGSTINIGNALNLAATPVLIASYAQAFTAATMPGTYLAATYLPVSAYSSIIVKIRIIGTYLSAVLAAGPSLQNIVVGCFAFTDATNYPSDNYLPQWALATDGATVQTFQMPVTAPFFNISNPQQNFSYIQKAATATGGTVFWEVWGSSEVITKPKYTSLAPGLRNDLIAAGSSTTAQLANGVNASLLASRAGPCFLTAINSGALGTSSRMDVFAALYGNTVTSINGVSAPATIGAANTVPFTLPWAPLVIQLVTAGGALLTANVST